MRLKSWALLAVAAVGLSGCGTMGFMTTPSRLLAQERAHCRAMNDYLAQQRCLARCWERQQLLWAQEVQLDRELRTPTSLADDPMLADALFGG
ncbi:MAG: hypothetical protein AAGH41_11580 [Pseudomonadota bacterium]